MVDGRARPERGHDVLLEGGDHRVQPGPAQAERLRDLRPGAGAGRVAVEPEPQAHDRREIGLQPQHGGGAAQPGDVARLRAPHDLVPEVDQRLVVVHRSSGRSTS